jgi:hypothetical protein
MKAIVLSCDKYHVFARHMVKCYNELWPDHPFFFRIACQQVPQNREEWSSRVEFCEVPSDIKSSVLGLLSDVEDNEFIYWCIDDKYPISFDFSVISAAIESLHRLPVEICGLLLCRDDNLKKAKHLGPFTWLDREGRLYVQRINYRQIWIHQFVRAKVIRDLFNQFPSVIVNAKSMDGLKNQASLPSDQILLVSNDSYCVFGESTSRGVITANCLESFRSKTFDVPAWACGGAVRNLLPRKRIIIGA